VSNQRSKGGGNAEPVGQEAQSSLTFQMATAQSWESWFSDAQVKIERV